MPKIKKKLEPLQVGEHIFIESTNMFYNGKRYINEYVIVETNKSSAYAVHIDYLEKERPSRTRIDQRTRKVFSQFTRDYFWATKEAFERSVKRQEDTALLRKQALEKVNDMNLEQLQQFLNGTRGS